MTTASVESNADKSLADRCPCWCVREDLQDATTQADCHPEDFTTWRNGAWVEVPVERPGRDTTTLEVALQWFDPDRNQPDDPTPQIDVTGEDGSDNMGGLELPVDAAELLALRILELVKAARA